MARVRRSYRYFRSAEELWEEAALFNFASIYDPAEFEAAIEAAGDGVEARPRSRDPQERLGAHRPRADFPPDDEDQHRPVVREPRRP